MKKAFIAATAAALALAACNDESQIGQSIVQDSVEVIVDSAFTITGSSFEIGKVQSRTTSQLLGRIDAPGFGILESDIVTQFMPSSTLANSSVTAADIDSIMLYFYMADGEYVGDTIAPMGLEVYRLTKALPSPIYSDFDPSGYYDPKPLASTIYNVADVSRDEPLSTGKEIAVELPKELGSEIYQAYLDNKANFASPSAFIDNVFKGLYIKNSYGSGRLIRATSTMMSLFYHYYEEDSLISGTGNYFAVTPEIITNNDVTLTLSDSLQQCVDAGQQLVVGPVGLGLEVQFPIPEILASYRSHAAGLKVLNSLSFSVPSDPVSNPYSFGQPTYLLMVLAKDRESFFAGNNLPDNITSFYATYDATLGGYNFGQMRQYLATLVDKENITAEDYTFAIVPVSAIFETSSSYYSTSTTLTLMTPYMASPVMTRLHLDRSKIKLTYSTQTIAD